MCDAAERGREEGHEKLKGSLFVGWFVTGHHRCKDHTYQPGQSLMEPACGLLTSSVRP